MMILSVMASLSLAAFIMMMSMMEMSRRATVWEASLELEH